MNTKHIITIWKKELKDTIRDRRTLISMVLVPMLLIPVLIFGMLKFMQSQEESQARQALKVAVTGSDNAPDFYALIAKEPRFALKQAGADPKQSVADGELDAAVIIPADFREKLAREEAAGVTLVVKSTNTKAASVPALFSALVSEYNARLVEGRLGARGLSGSVLSGVTLVPEDAATGQEQSGFILGLLIPLFIVMWSIAGGQYTAIDVSAGEKERKTLEALLLTPVRRTDIVLGKFLAVSTVALTSIVLSIGSLYLSFTYTLKSGLPMGSSAGVNAPDLAGLSFSVSGQTVVLLFLVSVFLVMLFSAFLLSISIFARSFKEAESYISPAYLVVILPVVFANMVPGFQPALWYFLVPAVNAILLFKELLMGTWVWAHILLTFASLAVYSLAAIWAASRIYARESVLFND